MGIFDRFSKRSTLANPEPWLLKALGVSKAASGVNVNHETALRSTAVFGCVRILSESIGQIPRSVWQATGAGVTRNEAPDHPLYSVIHPLFGRANPEMATIDLFETLTAHAALRGNGYGEIVRDKGGDIREIWPLDPRRVHLERRDGELFLVVDAYGSEQAKGLRYSDQVLHIHTLAPDGVVGTSPIQMAREAIGLALATEEFGARLFSNDARPGGYLQHPGTLSQVAQDRLKANWEAAHSGLGNSHRLAILEEGLSYQTVGIAPEDAQFLQTRKFQIAEISRIFRIPLHLLNELDKATFSNIEQQSIEFVVYTLGPWIGRWQEAFARSAFSEGERRARFFVAFDVRPLLRGDAQTTAEALKIERENGIINADEWRAERGLNPLGGASGTTYIVPANMTTAERLANPPEPPAPVAPPPAGGLPEQKSAPDDFEARAVRSATTRRRIGQSYRTVFAEAASRVLRREKTDVVRGVEKVLGRREGADVATWLGSFYADHRDFIETNMSPAFAAYGQAIHAEAADEIGLRVSDAMPAEMADFLKSYTSVYVERYAGLSLGVLQKAVAAAATADDIVRAVSDVFAQWEKSRASDIAREETVRAGDAVAKATYVSGGVKEIRWVAFGNSCPYCSGLNGRSVQMNEHFIGAGEDFQPEGADAPLSPQGHIGHAPAHRGCDCSIVAGGFARAASDGYEQRDASLGRLVDAIISLAQGRQKAEERSDPAMLAAAIEALNGFAKREAPKVDVAAPVVRFSRGAFEIDASTTIADGAVKVDAPTNISRGAVESHHHEAPRKGLRLSYKGEKLTAVDPAAD